MKKFLIVVLFVLIVNAVSGVVNLINSGHKNDYKVVVKLTNGTTITGYTTKQAYEDYLRHSDLKLHNKTIDHDTILYVIQTYNPYGTKEVNLRFHYQ